MMEKILFHLFKTSWLVPSAILAGDEKPQPTAWSAERSFISFFDNSRLVSTMITRCMQLRAVPKARDQRSLSTITTVCQHCQQSAE